MKVYEFECPITNQIFTIKVGENADENWNIIRESDGTDLWFHVDKFPSCHVILLTESIPAKKIHKSILNFCASLAKQGSKQKTAKNVSIIYTEIKNVTIDSKGNAGSVFTQRTKKLKS